ncbi:hypothetical protein Tco_1092178 [Tanacetum coccineum]|uniref:Uncharacterized protein n=1 Tax=Tanacetum coccineum TaxID=301880 RepID=A0ABQ5IAG8_9ASTR
MSLHTTVLGQHAVITELQAANPRRQAAITELLAADRKRQAQLIEVTKTGKETTDPDDRKMAPKRATRLNTSLETTTTTTVTNAQLQAMINKGVTAALAARDAIRRTNDDDNHVSRTSVRRTERVARECALTWWNSYVRTISHDVAMFLEESDKIQRYVGGLPDMIHRSVVASKPKTMQEAIEIESELMDKKIRTLQNDLVRRSHTGDLNPYALNATITMMVHVLPNVTRATELAIWLMNVGVPPMPTLLTTKGALGQVRNPLAMNVEPRNTSSGIVQS